jgi:RimJ/RimL family protein N-acetyltransferase
MQSTRNYIYQSERLGFRNWEEHDVEEFALMNADPEVMEHFPAPMSFEESREFIQRLLSHYDKWGYNYFATEILATDELIGFIGLAYQDFESNFTPCTDIGWRLKRSAWGFGYATEGARRSLEYGFEHLNIDRIISTCPASNNKSVHVMNKIDMTRMGVFNHPKLKEHPTLEKCIWYEIKRQK